MRMIERDHKRHKWYEKVIERERERERSGLLPPTNQSRLENEFDRVASEVSHYKDAATATRQRGNEATRQMASLNDRQKRARSVDRWASERAPRPRASAWAKAWRRHRWRNSSWVKPATERRRARMATAARDWPPSAPTCLVASVPASMPASTTDRPSRASARGPMAARRSTCRRLRRPRRRQPSASHRRPRSRWLPMRRWFRRRRWWVVAATKRVERHRCRPLATEGALAATPLRPLRPRPRQLVPAGAGAQHAVAADAVDVVAAVVGDVGVVVAARRRRRRRQRRRGSGRRSTAAAWQRRRRAAAALLTPWRQTRRSTKERCRQSRRPPSRRRGSSSRSCYCCPNDRGASDSGCGTPSCATPGPWAWGDTFACGGAWDTECSRERSCWAGSLGTSGTPSRPCCNTIALEPERPERTWGTGDGECGWGTRERAHARERELACVWAGGMRGWDGCDQARSPDHLQ